MAKRSSADVGFLLIDGFNVLASTTQLTDSVEALLEDTTPLGASWAVHEFVGVKKVEITQNGYYDAATGAINAALAEAEGTERILTYNLEGNVTGRAFTGFAGALLVKYDRILATSELHKANASYMGNGAIVEGAILLPHGQQDGAGNSEDAGVDNGASSAGGGVAYLQVSGLNLGGGTNCVVKVRDSADGVSYTDIVTFAAVTVAPAAQVLAAAGTIRRYLAVSWAFTGGANQDITLFVGFARNN